MRILAAILLPLLAVAAPAQAAPEQKDILSKKDGSMLRGIAIQSMTLKSTKYQKGSETLEVAAHQVAGVEWGAPSEAHSAALSALTRREFENAKQLFGEAANKAERPVLKTDLKFQQCRAAVAAAASNPSSAADAAGALKAWTTENADNWRLPEALLLLGRAQRLAKLGDDAVATLRTLDERATAEAWGPVWGARAKFEMALAHLDRQKGSDARMAFQAASSAADAALGQGNKGDADELRELQTNARVGEGETYISDKNYDQALRFYGALAGRDNPALAAAAKAGEGQALYLQAADEKKVPELRRAQIALATACVIDPMRHGEASAKANYFLGKCLLLLGPELEGDACKKRAIAYFQNVVRNYGDSRWVAAAQEELGK